jgi:hypothetical protein
MISLDSAHCHGPSFCHIHPSRLLSCPCRGEAKRYHSACPEVAFYRYFWPSAMMAALGCSFLLVAKQSSFLPSHTATPLPPASPQHRVVTAFLHHHHHRYYLSNSSNAQPKKSSTFSIISTINSLTVPRFHSRYNGWRQREKHRRRKG